MARQSSANESPDHGYPTLDMSPLEPIIEDSDSPASMPSPSVRRRRVSSSPQRLVTTPRRRRVGGRSTRITPERQARGSLRQESPGVLLNATEDISSLVGPAAGFLWDILLTGLRLVKKPVVYAIVLYVFLVLLSFAFKFALHSLQKVAAPFCLLPGAALLDIPFCGYVLEARSGKQQMKGDFPKLINLQSNFESILENSVGGSSMALDLKNSEVAVRDLSTLVRVSKLLCRDELSNRLDDFVVTAKSTSRGLTRFGSRVNGVVDSLLAMDEYALRALEDAQTARIGASSSTGSVIVSIILLPFRGIGYRDPEKDILSSFVQASGVMDTSIQRLIMEAESVLRDLDDLENRLAVIQDMVSREDSVIKERHEEVLAQLWSILGGNRQKLVNFASHRSLLANIAVYRTKALAHVGASLIQLQQMQADLEDLRDRVTQPALLGDGDIPLEVHIESIRKGVDRLNDGREKARSRENDYMKKMLSMHNEAIQALDARG